MMKIIYQTIALGAFVLLATSPTLANNKLTGTVMGSLAVDYTTNASSTTVNTCANAFDGNLSTYFASYERHYTWCGLDLGQPHIIKRVGWSPRNDGQGEKRVQLGIFEGANKADFSDAVPLYIIPERGTIGQMSYADVNVSRGVRYVRYVGPHNARCNIAEVEFYGYAGNGDDSQFYQLTNLPTVTIHTENNVEPYDKVNQIVSTISIISKDGKHILTQPGTTRLRGNASLGFPKKPYRIKFDKKQKVLDAPAEAKKWTLLSNYSDKTLMRNMVAFRISQILEMPYTPYFAAVDVMLNGEYQGCYQLCDQIDIRKGRVDITEMEPTDITGANLTGGYLIEVDAYADQEISKFNSKYGTPVTIKSPEDDVITPEQSQYIADYFSKMEKAVYSSNYRDPVNGYRSKLDLSSFLRHFLVGELSGNTDTYWSVYMYKERNNPLLYTGPVWDFDIAFNNDYRTYDVNDRYDFIYRNGGSRAGAFHQIVDRIVIHDLEARAQLEAIWSNARNHELTAEKMVAYIDAVAADVETSRSYNFTRWDNLNSGVHMNPKVYGSYEGELDALKEYITRRFPWMDDKMHYTPTTDMEDVPIDYLLPYEVYSITGVYQGESLQNLPPGVYIIRQGKQVEKCLVP